MRAASRHPAGTWVEGIVSQQEVQELIHDLQVKNRLQCTPSTLHAVFAGVKHLPAGTGTYAV
jgi:hypothetical protein